MIKVVVTEREYNKAQSVFSRAEKFQCIPVPPAEEKLALAIRSHGARHAIVGVEKYVGPLYAAVPPGGVLARYGVGHDGIDKEKATAAGLFCTNTPHTLDDSVAEHTMTLILAAARHIVPLASSLKTGPWTFRMGIEISEKTLAVIGCGAIGRRVARIAAFGFNMNVIGCEILDLDLAEMRSEHGFANLVKDFAEAVATADFVSLHIPSDPATRHFINEDRLRVMAANDWLINTARGALVDECALFDALKSGVIRGAALDVFEIEPYQPVDARKDLRTLDNVIMTPHVASSTQEASDRIARRALHNIELAESGNYEDMDLLNPAVLGKGDTHEK